MTFKESSSAKHHVWPQICQGDEVEDLYRLVERAAAATGAEGVSVGAILSDYQRVRVESVCHRLQLTALAFLWRRDQVGTVP